MCRYLAPPAIPSSPRAHAVEPVVGERTEQAAPTRRAELLLSRIRHVGDGAEFSIEIENALGHWPAEREIATELRACVVRDGQHIRPVCIRRSRAELTFEDSKRAPAPQLAGNQTNRHRSTTGEGRELEVHGYYLAELIEHQPRRRLITGWS